MKDLNRNEKYHVTCLRNNYKDKGFAMSKVEGLTGLDDYPEIVAKFNTEEMSLLNSDLIFLQQGDVLDLSRNTDLIRFMRARLYRQVAFDGATVNGNVHKVLLINHEKEAQKEAESYELKIDAMAYIKTKMNEKNKKSLYLYLGLPDFDNRSLVAIKTAIYQEAEQNPDKVIRFFDEQDLIKDELIVREMVHDGIIKSQSNGYTFRNEIVATTMDALIRAYKEQRSLRASLNAAFRDHGTASNSVKTFEKVEDKAKEREEFLSLKYEYLKKFGKEYNGEETIHALKLAFEVAEKDKENEAKKAAVDVNKKAFIAKYGDMPLGNMIKSATSRKDCPTEEWDSIREDREAMYEYLYKKEFND